MKSGREEIRDCRLGSGRSIGWWARSTTRARSITLVEVRVGKNYETVVSGREDVQADISIYGLIFFI